MMLTSRIFYNTRIQTILLIIPPTRTRTGETVSSKFWPVIVNLVPPSVLPWLWEMELISGGETRE